MAQDPLNSSNLEQLALKGLMCVEMARTGIQSTGQTDLFLCVIRFD